MAADFQANERTKSCWLRQEIRKAGLFSPFMRTTGGVRSKVDCASGLSAWALPLTETCVTRGASSTATLRRGRPAAAQAPGLVMPALVRAAAILDCWVMSPETEEGTGSERRTTSGGDLTGEPCRSSLVKARLRLSSITFGNGRPAAREVSVSVVSLKRRF